LCGFGKFQDQIGQSFCSDCAPGKFVSSEGARSCEPCRKGTYRNANSSEAGCLSCPQGRYSEVLGAQDCLPCPAGTSTNALRDGCDACASTFFNPRPGGACRLCPTEAFASANRITCNCPEGKFLADVGGDQIIDCLDCPFGSACNREGLTIASMTPSSGFWRTANDSMAFLRCLQPAHCTPTGCAPNRYGVLCALCLPGYKAASFGAAACEPCPTDQSSLTEAILVAVALCFILLLMCVVVWRLDSSQAAAQLSKDQMFILHPADMIDLLGSEDESTTEETANSPSFQFNVKIILGFLQIISGLAFGSTLSLPFVFCFCLSLHSFVVLSFLCICRYRCFVPINVCRVLVVS
jgi:hypothetical protein